jgi:hypothetical protein
MNKKLFTFNYRREPPKSLILLSIEHKLAKILDYDDVIDSFAEKKAKKKFSAIHFNILYTIIN